MHKFNLKKVQDILRKMKLDAWLLYDFRFSNELALAMLGISKKSHLTRRFYYLIPQKGEPKKIANAIETFHFDGLPGKLLPYASYDSLLKNLKKSLYGIKTVAMEYSPLNAIPYVSRVDAGTIEQISSLGVKIVSSADLISMYNALWTKKQFDENKSVAYALNDIVQKAFGFIKKKILSNGATSEYEVQQFIMSEFKKRKLFTDDPPIVGVNENSANPHYTPTKQKNKKIKKGDFVLIDLWAKQNKEDAVWADITWVGFVGDSVPSKYSDIFAVVAQARDEAFNLVDSRFKAGKEVRGYEVDSASRKVIEDAGYGKYFIHRTGHSITTDLHGSGAHIDNFETKDEILLLPSTSFSLEPGIYFPGDFGVRSEIDVFITSSGKVIYTGKEKQKEVIAILK
ncbi:MAG: M24 family metallopeptidase [Ignavibacteriaceae bacterium]|nr:M24 family metallopeptidase [Ignavibacteriaceae bacterium]